MKNKHKSIVASAGAWIILTFFIGMFSIDIRSVDAISACVTQNPTGWACTDTKWENPGYIGAYEEERRLEHEQRVTQCKTGLCPGSAEIKCCPYMFNGKFDLIGPIDREGDGHCREVSIQLCKDEAANPIGSYYNKGFECFKTEMYWRCGTLLGETDEQGCAAFGGKVEYDASKPSGQKYSCVIGGVATGFGGGEAGGGVVDETAGGTTNVQNKGSVAGMAGAGSFGGSAVGGTVFTNPLAFDTVEGFLSHFLTVLQRIIVTLSLVFIVIGAVMYIISAGNSGMVEKAKGAITASLIGLALGIAAPSFLKEISFVLGWGPTGSAEVDTALTLTEISLNVLNFLLAAVGILSILMMVLGGAMYLASAGNEDRIQNGKDIAKNAIIGIIISLSAMVLVRQIAEFFAR